jgi:hypothetical protein
MDTFLNVGDIASVLLVITILLEAKESCCDFMTILSLYVFANTGYSPSRLVERFGG